MYWLLGIDALIRIGAAMAVLFVIVPALAWPRPQSFGRMEWFWWCLGVGITILTLVGQLFTLLNIAGPLTYALLLVAIIVLGRARQRGMGPLQLIREAYRRMVVLALHAVEGHVSFRRRFRRAARHAARALRPWLNAPVWIAIALAAALTRFYRPFATANLGYSDTYVHLYLMRLLDQGRQVDPAWGPYPRGMHFLLLAIQRLTNADPILMLNFFGAFAGVLMTLSVAYAAKRAARSNAAALVAGLVFATMIGGARQYFVLGGSVSAQRAVEARQMLDQPYAALAEGAGEFDVLLTAFQRQTSTLPQELAIALLFPASLFLLDWLRTRDRWRLAGFVGCTAAVAAVHSGVVIPLVLLCGAAAIAAPNLRLAARAALFGALGVALGSTWMLGFLFYHRSVHTESTALYYFPFLRPFAGGNEGAETAFMTLTPFLIAMLIVAVIVSVYALRRGNPYALWLSMAAALFVLTHAASVIGIPEVVEVRRNASWLAMAIAALLGVAVALAQSVVRTAALPAIVIAAWLITIPNLFGPAMRARLLDYSGYGGTTYAVLLMSHRLEPFTWTLVSYGQEYPMVLGQGFHLNGADFLERFDPAEAPLRIPTPWVFIAVEKRPHRFQINNWSTRFDRAAIEERLQTWCTVYRLTHRDMRVWLDDDHVRVYAIWRDGRTGGEVARR